MTDADTSGPVKSADRALSIIALLADRGTLRFQDILDELGLARSSAHGLLHTLEARGWIAHDRDARTYTLGLKAWQVGQQFDGHRELAKRAKPLMDSLAHLMGETVQLARLDGIENVYIAISDSPHPMRLASSVGMRLHAHATALGKALLAQVEPDEVQRRLNSVVLPRFTEHTVTDPVLLRDQIASVRKAGYALDQGEYLPGTQCVAVPLLDDGEGLVTALSITAPSSRCLGDWPGGVLDELSTAAGRIREQMGFSAATLR